MLFGSRRPPDYNFPVFDFFSPRSRVFPALAFAVASTFPSAFRPFVELDFDRAFACCSAPLGLPIPILPLLYSFRISFSLSLVSSRHSLVPVCPSACMSAFATFDCGCVFPSFGSFFRFPLLVFFSSSPFSRFWLSFRASLRQFLSFLALYPPISPMSRFLFFSQSRSDVRQPVLSLRMSLASRARAPTSASQVSSPIQLAFVLACLCLC